MLVLFALAFHALLWLRIGMGYQFFHVESYGRVAGKGKAGGHSVASVIAEATREPDACPHVEAPQPPVPLFGCSLAEVEAKAIAWAGNSVDALGRKLRKDGLCLLSGVVSAPEEMSGKDWDSMKRDAIEWLNRDGRLMAVIEHTDEAYRHIHFYKIPAPGQRFESVHPGRAAALVAKNAGAVKGEQNRAYKEAMRGLQDDFFSQVGARYGLTRLGPAKRRLTRSEWKAEKVAALSLSKAMANAEDLIAQASIASQAAVIAQAVAEKAKLEAANSYRKALAMAEKAKNESDKIQAEMSVEKEKLEKAKTSNAEKVKKLRKEKAAMDSVAQRLMEERAEIERWQSRGGKLGTFVGKAFDAVVGVFTNRAGRERKQREQIAAANRAIKKAQSQTEEAKADASRARLQRDAASEVSRKQLRIVEAERDAAQQVVDGLSKPAQSHRHGPTIRH